MKPTYFFVAILFLFAILAGAAFTKINALNARVQAQEDYLRPYAPYLQILQTTIDAQATH